MKKSLRHEAIRERAREAIRNMYHNATPKYPCLDDAEAKAFQSWFEDAAEFEIEYLNDGGSYGKNPLATFTAAANKRYPHNARARQYYIRTAVCKMREERARCNNLDSRQHLTNAMWERITELGRLYTWGRGGRTLAPDDLVKKHGGSRFGMDEEYPDNMSIRETTELIQIVESFNKHVASWCKAVPEMWKEYLEDWAHDIRTAQLNEALDNMEEAHSG